MPLIFISLDQDFVDKIRARGFEAYRMDVENYEPKKYTYYISSSNSSCRMTGGFDKGLSEYVFPYVGYQQLVIFLIFLYNFIYNSHGTKVDLL